MFRRAHLILALSTIPFFLSADTRPYYDGYAGIYSSYELDIQEGSLDDEGNIVPPSYATDLEVHRDAHRHSKHALPWCCDPYCPDPTARFHYWPNLTERQCDICTNHTRYFIKHLRGWRKH